MDLHDGGQREQNQGREVADLREHVIQRRAHAGQGAGGRGLVGSDGETQAHQSEDDHGTHDRQCLVVVAAADIHVGVDGLSTWGKPLGQGVEDAERDAGVAARGLDVELAGADEVDLQPVSIWDVAKAFDRAHADTVRVRAEVGRFDGAGAAGLFEFSERSVGQRSAQNQECVGQQDDT